MYLLTADLDQLCKGKCLYSPNLARLMASTMNIIEKTIGAYEAP
jgi:hypothetical protein